MADVSGLAASMAGSTGGGGQPPMPQQIEEQDIGPELLALVQEIHAMLTQLTQPEAPAEAAPEAPNVPLG